MPLVHRQTLGTTTPPLHSNIQQGFRGQALVIWKGQSQPRHVEAEEG